jgi:hypothetical protein
MKQKDFFHKHSEHAKKSTHGGDAAKGKRKIRRPLDKKKSVHVVARAEKAKGKYNLRNGNRELRIDRIIRDAASKHGVTVHYFQNVGNHFHLSVSFKVREYFQNFLRRVMGLIAREATGARKGKPFGKFWDALVFTRVVHGRRDFAGLTNYIDKNRAEVEFGPLARRSIEEYEKAARTAKRRGCEIWEVLESS